TTICTLSLHDALPISAERNEYVLDSARPPFVLTTAAAAGRLPAAAKCVIVEDLELGAFDPAPISDRERSAALRPDNTAYVIYTSDRKSTRLNSSHVSI